MGAACSYYGRLALHPDKVARDHMRRFTDLPNIGPAMARDFACLGYDHPQQLVGADPLALYASLCETSGRYQDPCVLDTLMSVTDFLGGGKARPWWHYTAERKRRYATALADVRSSMG